MKEIRYYHELNTKEKNDIMLTKDWSWIARKHPQPLWCTHPNALEGLLGCEDLCYLNSIRVEDDCGECPFRKGIKS